MGTPLSKPHSQPRKNASKILDLRNFWIFKIKDMNKTTFEIIYNEVAEAVEDRLLSNQQRAAFNIIVKTRHGAEYKISSWKVFSRSTVGEAENNYRLSDLALLVVTTKYVAAIPYNEIVEINAEATKE